MSATVSLLRLETYFLIEISYSLKDNLDVIPENVEAIAPIELEISDLTTLLDEPNSGWRCELTVESASGKGENPFYNFRIVMVGFFKAHENLSPADAKLLAESNCPAVLYSTSREIVATVTRRSPYPAILLPLVTFVKTPAAPPKKRKTAKKKVE